jgi:hypothetical protein
LNEWLVCYQIKKTCQEKNYIVKIFFYFRGWRQKVIYGKIKMSRKNLMLRSSSIIVLEDLLRQGEEDGCQAI